MSRAAFGRRAGSPLAALLLVLSAGCATQPAATGLQLGVQRLEPEGGSCRAVMTLGNRLDWRVDRLDLTLSYYRRGVSLGTTTARWQEIGPGRSAAAEIDMPVACDQIAGLVLREVPVCEISGSPMARCLDRLEISPASALPISAL